MIPLMKNCRLDFITVNNTLFTLLVDFTNNDNVIYSKAGSHRSIKELYSEFKYIAENMALDFYIPSVCNFTKIQNLNYKF